MHAQRSLLATFAIAATQVLAFDRITIPSTVQAGTDVEVTLTNDLSSSDSFDAGFTDYRVYLSVSAPNVGQGPVCYLVNQTAIDVTSVTVNIPASVGPSGSDVSPYAIVIMEYNSDPDKDGPSGFEYSNDFSLEGGTGVFTPYESARNSVGDADNIPCTAYDCARQCDQKNYNGAATSSDGSGVDDASYKAAYECIAQCPGVTYPPFDDADTGHDASGTPPADSSSSSNSTVSSSSSSSSSSADTSSTATAHGSSGATKSSSTSSSSQAGKTSGVAAADSEAGTLLVEKAMLALLGVTSMAVLTWL